MTEIKIGDRTIPLYYSAYESIAIQKEIGCTAFQLREEVFGLRQEDEDDENSLRMEVSTDPVKLERFGKLVRILGNAGLEQNGQEGDLTDKWVLRHMKPALVVSYAVLVLMEILEGNKIEDTEPGEKKGPVDVGLQEQEAKKQQGN